MADDVKENGAPDSASSSIVLAANADPAKDNSDIYAIDSDVAKTSLTTGAPPTMFGISHPERTLAPAGLGEGSPKVRSQMKYFCFCGIGFVCGCEYFFSFYVYIIIEYIYIYI